MASKEQISQQGNARASGDRAAPKLQLGRSRTVFNLFAAGLGISGLLGLLVVYLTYHWFVSPTSTLAPHADAVVVFAGGDGERLERGLDLIRAGSASVLALSQTGARYLAVDELCANPPSNYEVVCFSGPVNSTRGEAQAVSELANKRRWSSILLVTTDHHLVRSARWLRRCFSGRVDPVAAYAPTSVRDIIHEWLGTLAQYTIQLRCR